MILVSCGEVFFRPNYFIENDFENPQEKLDIEIMQNIIILGLFHIVLHILRLPISGDILDSEEYKNCILNDSKSDKSKQAFMLERLTPISAKK